MRVQRSASRAAGFTVRWLGRLPASPRSRVYARRAVPPTQTIAPAVRGVLRSSRLRPFSDPHAFSCPERLISIDPIIRHRRAQCLDTLYGGACWERSPVPVVSSWRVLPIAGCCGAQSRRRRSVHPSMQIRAIFSSQTLTALPLSCGLLPPTRLSKMRSD